MLITLLIFLPKNLIFYSKITQKTPKRISRSHAEQPWIRANDTNNEENEKAKEAYRALKTISLRRSDLDEYKNFELRVKERADQKYNYTNITGKDYEVSIYHILKSNEKMNSFCIGNS